MANSIILSFSNALTPLQLDAYTNTHKHTLVYTHPTKHTHAHHIYCTHSNKYGCGACEKHDSHGIGFAKIKYTSSLLYITYGVQRVNNVFAQFAHYLRALCAAKSIGLVLNFIGNASVKYSYIMYTYVMYL